MKFTPDPPSKWIEDIKSFLSFGRAIQRVAAVLNLVAFSSLLFWTYQLAQNQPYEIPLWHIALFAFLIVMLGTNAFLFFLFERYGSRWQKMEGPNRHDELTGVLNVVGMQEVLDREMRGAGRYHYPFSICLVDLDKFRAYNEANGHEKGNDLLRNFGNFLRGTVRFTDSVSRIENDEFLILLPHTDLIQTEKFLARIQLLAHERTDITFSAGITSYRTGESPSQLLERAKLAVSQARREGGKRIKCVIGHDDSPVILSF